LHVEQMLAPAPGTAASPDAAEIRGNANPRTPGSGATACACEVIRPPNDLPPAMSGSFGKRRAASATAARTAACASFGGSGRLLPRSM
jgi:hypothetical protein